MKGEKGKMKEKEGKERRKLYGVSARDRKVLSE